MNEDLVRMIYGDDAKTLFNGQMYIMFDGEKAERHGLIYKDTGKLVTDMKLRNVAALLKGEDIKGYLLIDETLRIKMYESFHKVTTNGPVAKIQVVSKTPIYTNAAILLESGDIVVGKCLIALSTAFHPSMTLKYNKKSYIGKFAIQEHKLEYLTMVT